MHSRGLTTSETAVPESQVKQAQQQLKSAGLYKGTVDGKMGSDTQQAIEQFQQKHGLPATGTLDEQTMAALQGNTGRAGSSSTPTPRWTALKHRPLIAYSLITIVNTVSPHINGERGDTTQG
jgi:peptidoglycan hydrolase-like protein with peptidoglycan-binding domain